MSRRNKVKSGMGFLSRDGETFAQVQGAWRFYNNDNVSISNLFEPILEQAEDKINNTAGYILCMSDWSHIDYLKHSSKKELTTKSNGGGKKQIGYELQTTLAVYENGQIIAPIVHNLKTDQQLISSYDENLHKDLDHVDEFKKRIYWIKEKFNEESKKVHIIDREGDVAGLYRELTKANERFVIRGKSQVNIYNLEDQQVWKQGELAKNMERGNKFKSIKYHNQNVDIYVNETDIEIRRDNTKKITIDGKTVSKRESGEPIKARLVVSKLINKNNELLATWILIANLEENVSKEQIAEWYYHRWKIESFFKILKSAGFEMESWQERDPMAIFRKLMVVSLALVFVWKLERDTTKEAEKLRLFLVQLSGRIISRGKTYTLPALLAGLWHFLLMLDTLEKTDITDIMSMQSQLNNITGFNF
jgi:hypothetical protein